MTELATWLAGMLIVAGVLTVCIFKGCDYSGLMSVFTGLAAAYGVRAVKGAVDRDVASKKAQGETQNGNS